MLKKSLSSLAVRRLSRELSSIQGSFFQKAYQLDYDTLVLRFAIRRELLAPLSEREPLIKGLLENSQVASLEHEEGVPAKPPDLAGNYLRFDLYFKMGGYLYLTPRVEREMPREPSAFAMKLRKSLGNRVLIGVGQVALDRVVVLEFEPGLEGGGNWRLYLELFGDGNAILVKGDIIEAPFTSRTWATRTLKRGEVFQAPPSSMDPSVLTLQGLRDTASQSSEDLVHFLIRKCNLPPIYAEEVCFRLGMDKRSGLDGSDEAFLGRLLSTIRGLLDEVDQGTGAAVHFRDGAPECIEPIPVGSFFGEADPAALLAKYSREFEGGAGAYLLRFPSLNRAVETYMPSRSGEEVPRELPGGRERERLKRLLEEQTSEKATMEVETEDLKALGDAIYVNYGRVSDILSGFDPDAFREDRSAWPEVVSTAPDDRGGKGTVRIRLPTERGEKEADLDLSLDINANANAVYDLSKWARRKAEGLEKAIAATRERMAEAEDPEELPSEGPRVKIRSFWFESYHWCFSSEGVLMIAGRDARSNEKLVKKYMRDTDLYAHADLSGAASVVIRIEKDQTVSDATKVEACHMSVLHSKAWNSKLGYAGAYWVLPEQVSRTPQSGEFVAKGSFIIRGRKNMVEKLPLIGAAGTLYVEGVPKVMFGPESAVSKMCSGAVFRMTPGRTKKTDAAKLLVKELGGDLDQIMSVLPPGDLELERIERTAN